MPIKENEPEAIPQLQNEVHTVRQVLPICNGEKVIVRSQNGDDIVQDKVPLSFVYGTDFGNNFTTLSSISRISVPVNIRKSVLLK